MMTFDIFSALNFPRGNICPSNGGRSSCLQKAGKVYKNWSVKKKIELKIFWIQESLTLLNSYGNHILSTAVRQVLI